MPQTILDILTSDLPNESQGDLRSSDEDLYLSIRDHLRRLFNARRGSLTHLPHFGMPDIAALYLELPYTSDRIMTSIRQCVIDFEPRLCHPQVRAVQRADDRDVTQFELVGETLQGRRLKYVVSLYRDGSIVVSTTWEQNTHG